MTHGAINNRLKQFVSVPMRPYNKLSRLIITSVLLLPRNAWQHSRDFVHRTNSERTGTHDRRNETNAQTDARHLFDVPHRCLHPASSAPNNRGRSFSPAVLPSLPTNCTRALLGILRSYDRGWRLSDSRNYRSTLVPSRIRPKSIGKPRARARRHHFQNIVEIGS